MKRDAIVKRYLAKELMLENLWTTGLVSWISKSV
jgi:hypothetical protein